MEIFRLYSRHRCVSSEYMISYVWEQLSRCVNEDKSRFPNSIVCSLYENLALHGALAFLERTDYRSVPNQDTFLTVCQAKPGQMKRIHCTQCQAIFSWRIYYRRFAISRPQNDKIYVCGRQTDSLSNNKICYEEWLLWIKNSSGNWYMQLFGRGVYKYGNWLHLLLPIIETSFQPALTNNLPGIPAESVFNSIVPKTNNRIVLEMLDARTKPRPLC